MTNYITTDTFKVNNIKVDLLSYKMRLVHFVCVSEVNFEILCNIYCIYTERWQHSDKWIYSQFTTKYYV
jgi:hypothetical protein